MNPFDSKSEMTRIDEGRERDYRIPLYARLAVSPTRVIFTGTFTR